MQVKRTGSAAVQIIVALISVAGALGVAFITTQAKFSSELESRAPELAQMKAHLDAAEKRLSQQQQEMDRKVAAVEERLRRLDTQIELAQSAATTLLKASSKILGGAKK